MKCDMSRRRMDSDHLRVANPIRPEDLDRRVTHQGVYPLLPASHGIQWSAYVRSQRVGSRSVSSSTDALDSDQARADHSKNFTTYKVFAYKFPSSTYTIN